MYEKQQRTLILPHYLHISRINTGSKGVTPLETNAAAVPLLSVTVFRNQKGTEHAFGAPFTA